MRGVDARDHGAIHVAEVPGKEDQVAHVQRKPVWSHRVDVERVRQCRVSKIGDVPWGRGVTQCDVALADDMRVVAKSRIADGPRGVLVVSQHLEGTDNGIVWVPLEEHPLEPYGENDENLAEGMRVSKPLADLLHQVLPFGRGVMRRRLALDPEKVSGFDVGSLAPCVHAPPKTDDDVVGPMFGHVPSRSTICLVVYRIVDLGLARLDGRRARKISVERADQSCHIMSS